MKIKDLLNKIDSGSINLWVVDQGLAAGAIAFDYADANSGQQLAVFDLAWPDGLQLERSEPVVLLLNEDSSTQSLASEAGYRCFTSVDRFKTYVKNQILQETETIS